MYIFIKKENFGERLLRNDGQMFFIHCLKSLHETVLTDFCHLFYILD